MTNVTAISPIPETNPGISIFCIIGLRIITFRYCRSLTALSCQSQTTIPDVGKTVPRREVISCKANTSFVYNRLYLKVLLQTDLY